MDATGSPVDVVVFDVNETLSDMTPLATRFETVGASAHLMKTWFASVLRDGFALAAAGASAPFADIARDVLTGMLAGTVADVDGAAQHVLDGFDELDVHPDVPDGVRALRSAGMRLVTLTNGSVELTEGLLGRAGIRDEFERLLSVQQAGRWKPAQAAYDYAAGECGADPARMLLVAVHPWDIDGASRAGLRTAWVDREGVSYPAHLRRPSVTVAGLDELATSL
ncbi:MAG: haloacid dehalogenase [Frankiales bacterium]|nr:haloacid dehalogenase [Frankiales bacterium]